MYESRIAAGLESFGKRGNPPNVGSRFMRTISPRSGESFKIGLGNYRCFAEIAHQRALARIVALEAPKPVDSTPKLSRAGPRYAWVKVQAVMGRSWMSFREIAKAAKMPVQNVKNHMRRHADVVESSGVGKSKKWRLN